MPRPRTVGPGEVISAKLPSRIIEQLRKLEAKKGVPRSVIIREAIEFYLRSHGLDIEGESSGDSSCASDPPLDPLTQLEIEDFEEQLSNFENELAKLKNDADKVKQLINDLGYGSGTRPFPSHLLDYMKTLSTRAAALKREWLRLKGWYRKQLPPNAQLAERLVAARRTLKEIEALGRLRK